MNPGTLKVPGTDAFIERQSPHQQYATAGRGGALVKRQGFRMEIHFSKLHGNGNDFIVIDEWEHVVIPDEMKGQFAACYCDRRFGIGADGVIYLMKSEKCDLRMRIFQPDEREAEMSGNDIPCIAKYAFDAGYIKGSCTVETLSGKIGVSMGYREDGFMAITTMTSPKFDRPDIPATGTGEYHERIGEYDVYATNTGVPHAVIVVDAVDAVDVAVVAPAIRAPRLLPERGKCEFRREDR